MYIHEFAKQIWFYTRHLLPLAVWMHLLSAWIFSCCVHAQQWILSASWFYKTHAWQMRLRVTWEQYYRCSCNAVCWWCYRSRILVWMSIVPIALRIYPSNSHSIVTLFLIVYVYNNALFYYCDELLDSIEVSNTEDASRKRAYGILFCYTI